MKEQHLVEHLVEDGSISIEEMIRACEENGMTDNIVYKSLIEKKKSLDTEDIINNISKNDS